MKIHKNTLVDIQQTILPAGQRAPQVPQDTGETDLIMRVKGILLEDAEIGQEAEIRTPIGRKLRGTLIAAQPPYTHGFGEPIPELLTIGTELREQLSNLPGGDQ